MKRQQWYSTLLLIAIVVVANLIARQLFFRIDLTENNQYTLSPATKDILRNLEQPVTVTAYFSENMPPNIAKARRDFQEMLVEYRSLSNGYVDYQFINPDEESEQQEAMQTGIQPVMINVREKDQAKQQQAYLGAVISLGDQQEVLPFIQPGAPMEYELSTSIKKLAVQDKPSIAILQGHGEAGLQQLAQAVQSLSVLYQVETFDLSTEASIPDRFRAAALVAPTDTLPPADLAKLDDYLSQGGQLLIALNSVEGDLQNAQGSATPTGVEDWLAQKGIAVTPGFAIDAQCAPVQVQQQQGFFRFNTSVQFPFLPIVTEFSEHPAGSGLEQVVMPFASPLSFVGDSTVKYTPIALTSVSSGIVNAPTYFDINKQWTESDFTMSNLHLGAVLEGPLAGEAYARMIVFGDGNFPVNGQQGRQNEDNISLFVNSIDWLSDDTGLIELRTKAVASRPIDQEYLGEEALSTRNWLKYLNFGLPILLVLGYGLMRYQRQKRVRLQRQSQRFV